MAKIELDKYYTPKDIAKYCVEKTKEVIGLDNITEWLEPSAGNGSFLDYLDDNYIAYDIAPEDNRVVEQDYLSLDLDYKKGRCIVGNPPFGTNTLLKSFYKKSINLGDYISFILPISQLNNNYQFYEFDLIYSEDLGKNKYSNKNLHCCLNIYKRPAILNKKPNYKLKDVTLIENRRGENRNIIDENMLGICTFGKGIIGNIPKYKGQYVKEVYFKINNNVYKDELKNLIYNTDWESLVLGISGQKNLSMWIINKYIKEQIPNIN